GMSFKKYLTVYRISMAKQFLEKTDLKVSAIAMKVGFSNFQSFNISFKKYTGLTPTTYRIFYSQS
ncbi:helix-turn-helix transcriptional regulator, partial [bacterium]|nr:helix-turn-helix transcriptional regulator [bacterium]